MIYLKKYVPTDLYMSPSGALMDAAAVSEQFPAAAVFPHVVETDQAGQMMYGLYNLAAMRSQYGVDAALAENEAITAVADAMNAEQEAQREAANQPTVEERTAAALEFLAMNSLPDEEVNV